MTQASINRFFVVALIGLMPLTVANANSRKVSQSFSGKFIVRLKLNSANQLPLESVGRLLGGVVEKRLTQDPWTVIIVKDRSLAPRQVIAELLKNPVVESARPLEERGWGI